MILWLLVSACAPKSYSTISRIRFEGNGHPFSLTNNQNLRSAMAQKDVAWLEALRQGEDVPRYDPMMLQLDAWRIENWYAQHGYINAKVVGWSVYAKPNRFWRRHHRLVVTGIVEEGEQVSIRSIFWNTETQNLMQRELDSKLSVAVGDPLNWELIDASRESLLSLVQNRSYAYAKVDVNVDIWPGNCHQLLDDTGACLQQQIQSHCLYQKDPWCDTVSLQLKECTTDWCLEQVSLPYESMTVVREDAVADLTIHLREGPSTRFGEVEWLSTTTIDQAILDDQVPFKQGDSYKISQLAQFQRRLFALNQFSVVTVHPVLSGESTVPVQVTLSERKKREAAVGVGGNVDTGLVSLYGSFDFSHINLGNQLLSLDIDNKVGYAANLSLDRTKLFGGPTLHHVAQLFYPRFIKPVWAIGLEVDYELGIQPAYRFSSPKVAPYFSWKEPLTSKLYRVIEAQFSYYFTGFTYLDVQVEDSRLEEVVRLGYLGQQIVLDGRNDPVFPQMGRYTAINTYQANQMFGGDYNYAKVQLDQRRFISLIQLGSIRLPGAKRTIRQWRYHRGLEPFFVDGVLSYRWSMGALMPYGSFDQVDYAPNAEYFFLGGGSDVRGWQAGRLGPYVCTDNNCVDSTDVVPIGGTAIGFGSIEYRQYFPSDVGFAVFADVGRVWASLGEVSFADLQPSVGLGGRYISPIGPLRLDVACRLKEDPLFELEDKCRIHFAFSESY